MGGVQLSQHIVGPTLVIICVLMVITAAAVYWSTSLGSAWTVPRAAVRAVVQLTVVAAILTAALRSLGGTLWLCCRLCSSPLQSLRRAVASPMAPGCSRPHLRRA